MHSAHNEGQKLCLTFRQRFAVVFIAMYNETVYNKLYNRQNLSQTFKKGSEYLVKKTKQSDKIK